MEPISFREYLFNTWGGEASLKTLLGALRHSAASPMAGFEKMPEISGQPRLVLSTDAHKAENVMPEEQRLQLATTTASYGALRAGGTMPPVPDEIRKKVIVDISDRVMEKLSDGLYVTPTSLVATILALHRDGIREEDLIAQVAWLRDEVLARGGKLSPCVGGFSYAPFACVKTVLGRYLNSVVEQKGEGWTVTSSYAGDGLDAQGAPLRVHLPRLLLAYYRNQSMHVFANEAFVAVALSACGGPAAWKEGATMQEIQTHTSFLLKLLENHFVYSGKMNDDAVENVVSLMEQRGLLLRRKGGVGSEARFAFNEQQEAMVILLCCYLWPFVDSVWVLCVSLFTLQAHQTNNGNTKPIACASPQLRKRQLVARAHWLADGLCKQRILSFYESASFPTISQGVEGFLSLEVLRPVDGSKKDACAARDMLLELVPEYREEARLQGLVDRIFKFRRAAAFDASRPDAQPATLVEETAAAAAAATPTEAAAAAVRGDPFERRLFSSQLFRRCLCLSLKKEEAFLFQRVALDRWDAVPLCTSLRKALSKTKAKGSDVE
ncbi:hypothetical protein Esti_004019 [Eimeria stiedai]